MWCTCSAQAGATSARLLQGQVAMLQEQLGAAQVWCSLTRHPVSVQHRAILALLVLYA